MTPDLPYAIGCPSCRYYVEVSDVDPDASQSVLYGHISSTEANYDRTETERLLAKAVELTEDEAADR